MSKLGDIHVCTCPNRHLLRIGSLCDLCMGVVVDLDPIGKWPETVATDPFDELYFEELEMFYEDILYAT